MANIPNTQHGSRLGANPRLATLVAADQTLVPQLLGGEGYVEGEGMVGATGDLGDGLCRACIRIGDVVLPMYRPCSSKPKC